MEEQDSTQTYHFLDFTGMPELYGLLMDQMRYTGEPLLGENIAKLRIQNCDCSLVLHYKQLMLLL